jgi:hypothetical protein
MDKADILKRINELLAINPQTGRDSGQLSPACVSLLSLVYGSKSSQLEYFKTCLAGIQKDGSTVGWKNLQASTQALNVLQTLKQEIELGLTGSLKHQIASEVLTDFIQLARSILNESGDGAKNVAAVLTAAAFEDTVRRMGETFAGVLGKDDLADVLKKLKDAEVMKSPQVGIAQSYLSFRNHALHANWENIERESVHSVLGFVEQLLLKHFN